MTVSDLLITQFKYSCQCVVTNLVQLNLVYWTMLSWVGLRFLINNYISNDFDYFENSLLKDLRANTSARKIE